MWSVGCCSNFEGGPNCSGAVKIINSHSLVIISLFNEKNYLTSAGSGLKQGLNNPPDEKQASRHRVTPSYPGSSIGLRATLPSQFQDDNSRNISWEAPASTCERHCLPRFRMRIAENISWEARRQCSRRGIVAQRGVFG